MYNIYMKNNFILLLYIYNDYSLDINNYFFIISCLISMVIYYI